MSELHYNFFTNFSIVNNFDDLEMDTDSLNLAFAEKELDDCTRSEMKAEWEQLWSKDCNHCFSADAVENFFPRLCCDKHKKQDKREPGVPKEEFKCSELLRLC